MHFDVTTRDKQIICKITADTDLANPVFCFSLMAPPQVETGGTLLSHTGGYGEVQLPPLQEDTPHTVILRYADPAFGPANRAWLPLGAYLRHDAGLTALSDGPAGISAQNDPPFTAFDELRLVPQPRHWRPEKGLLKTKGFHWDHGTALDQVGALATRCNMAGFNDGETPISVETDPEIPDTGYRLTITSAGITLYAAGDIGVFSAGITLLTLLQTHPDGLPLGQISDAPRFVWRGQHLDCARHFYTVATIMRLLDLMALCKLNRFHWHFADDEAFRVQVDCLPDLWQGTAFRGEGQTLPGVFGGGIRAGGSYSKTDVATIVAHAKSLHIEVLPEIEIPAHALAFCRIFPETRDPAETGHETSVQGYTGNVANPAMPATLDKFKALASEITALFPFKHLHLGGDELPEDTWSGSPSARALMDANGLHTTDDLFGWTMAALGAHVRALGSRPAAWEEAARGNQGGIGNGAILFSWTGQGAGIDAARAGYDIVMTPAQHAYLDMAHSDDPQDWGANWAATISLEDTINWDPVPQNAPDIADRVIGIEGTFWSEFTTKDAQMEPMLAPRILGIACKAWQDDGTINAPQLRALAGHYRVIFDRIGWARHNGA